MRLFVALHGVCLIRGSVGRARQCLALGCLGGLARAHQVVTSHPMKIQPKQRSCLFPLTRLFGIPVHALTNPDHLNELLTTSVARVPSGSSSKSSYLTSPSNAAAKPSPQCSYILTSYFGSTPYYNVLPMWSFSTELWQFLNRASPT